MPWWSLMTHLSLNYLEQGTRMILFLKWPTQSLFVFSYHKYTKLFTMPCGFDLRSSEKKAHTLTTSPPPRSEDKAFFVHECSELTWVVCMSWKKWASRCDQIALYRLKWFTSAKWVSVVVVKWVGKRTASVRKISKWLRSSGTNAAKLFLKKWTIPGLFLFIFVFTIQLIENK